MGSKFKILVLAICLNASLFLAMPAFADSVLAIPGGVGSLTYFGGEYAGPIGATLNGNAIPGGIVCDDINAQTSVPNPGFSVYVSELSPGDMTNVRFGADPNALFDYEEASWLVGQMAKNPTQIGEMQFAVWRIFTPDARSTRGWVSYEDRKIENTWMAEAATAVLAGNLNYSSVRIYTTVDTANQEFISGGPTPTATPEPPTLLLVGFGLACLVGCRLRRRGRA